MVLGSFTLLFLATLSLLSSQSRAESTEDEAAILARRLLANTGTGQISTTMSSHTVFPKHPFSSVEYYADCPGTEFTGNPLLFMSVWSLNTQNMLTDKLSRVSLSVRMLRREDVGRGWDDENPEWNAETQEARNRFVVQSGVRKNYLSRLGNPAAREDAESKVSIQRHTSTSLNTSQQNSTLPTFLLPMIHARFTLIGHTTLIPMSSPSYDAGIRCFLSVHPDAKDYINMTSPDNHGFKLFKLNVEGVYWIGGLGDRHYIGWIDVNKYLDAKI